MKKRLDYIDAIRGFAIFLMVMGHVISWSFIDLNIVLNYGPNAASFWWRLIYSFHMPLFFSISGFLFGLGGGKTLNYYKKKISSLLIPFLLCGCFFHFVTGGPISKFWFLRTLFEVTLIQLPYETLKFKLHIGIKGDLIFYMFSFLCLLFLNRYNGNMLIGEVLDISNLASLNYMGFCLGIMLQRYDGIQYLLNNNWVYSLSLSLFVLFLFQPQYELVYMISPSVLCFSGIIISWYLMKYVFAEGPVVKFLRELGRNSLEVYIIHFFVNVSIVEVGSYIILLTSRDSYISILSGSMIQLLYGIIVSVFICQICLVIAKVFNSSRFLSVLFGGKSILK